MVGKKVALLVPVSQEIAMTNAAGLYAQLRQDLPTAIARAFDYAAIHGLDLRTGGAGPFADYLKKGASSIELGTASQATGGMYADLVNGEKIVVDAGYDFTGFAADPRLKPDPEAVDRHHRVARCGSTTPQSGINAGNLIGYPAFFNRGVSGAYRAPGQPGAGRHPHRHPDRWHVHHHLRRQHHARRWPTTPRPRPCRPRSGSCRASRPRRSPARPAARTPSRSTWSVAPRVRCSVNQTALTGGTAAASQATIADRPRTWTPTSAPSVATGRSAPTASAWTSRIKVSDSASYVDEAGATHSAFQENLVLLLVEAYYGFVKSDAAGAFVAYIDAA